MYSTPFQIYTVQPELKKDVTLGMACLKGCLLGGIWAISHHSVDVCRVLGVLLPQEVSLWEDEGNRNRWDREAGFQSEPQCAEIVCHGMLFILTAPGKER